MGPEDEAWSQAMQIHDHERRSQLSLCLAAANTFLLRDERALTVVRHQFAAIATNWSAACSEAQLGDADRRLLWRRQFLNDLAFEGLRDRLAEVLEDLARASQVSIASSCSTKRFGA